MARVVMYSSYLCAFCWMAKAMLKKKGVEYELRGVPMIMGWKPPVKNYKEMVERTGADYGAADFCRWGVSGG
jgi:glutaredoxin-related protein